MGISSSVGLISGINFGELIQRSVEIERRPIVLLEDRKISLQTVSAEFSAFSLSLSAFKTSASTLAGISSFNPNTVSVTTTSSDATLLSATADSTAVPGIQQIGVKQLAQAHSLAAQGFVDENTTAVASGSKREWVSGAYEPPAASSEV